VDDSEDVLHGPNPLQKSGAVTVPAPLLRAVGLDALARDRVHWMLNPDMPGTLVLVPTRLVEQAMPSVVKELRRLGK
jgi:hypothetical protein